MSLLRYYVLGAIAVAAFAGFDVYLAVDSIHGNTWSELGRAVACVTPVLPWSVAFLCGHVFHPKACASGYNIGLAVFLTWLVFVIGLACRHAGHPVPPWAPLAPGFFAGWLLWPAGGAP